MTPLPDEQAVGVTEACPAVPENRASDPSVPAAWKTAIRALAGTRRIVNVPADEIEAVYGLVAQLREDLFATATAADETVLASLARIQLLEWRLARHVFGNGALRKNGDVRPSLVELRQVVRLKADLLTRLRFRDGAKPEKTLNGYLAERATASAPRHAPTGDSSDAVVAPSADRAASPPGRSDGGQP